MKFTSVLHGIGVGGSAFVETWLMMHVGTKNLLTHSDVVACEQDMSMPKLVSKLRGHHRMVTFKTLVPVHEVEEMAIFAHRVGDVSGVEAEKFDSFLDVRSEIESFDSFPYTRRATKTKFK